MYQSIYVPVDNSPHSKRAVDLAVDLGKAFGAKLVGSHVYAAKMHEYRFKQMEYSLPEKYLEEKELERQRDLHDSIITMGLKLISESYVEPMKQRCEAEDLDFESKMMDGKNHAELVKDIGASGYDLVVMGALGLGRGLDSQIGSVCERVTREIDHDVWVVRRLQENGSPPSNTILVGIDGSPQSFGALMQAVELAKRFSKKIECVAVFDPYLHYSVFNALSGVLSKEATKVFDFEAQNELHEEIIDSGLAQIYQSHLNVAETMAAERGMEVVKTLLDGKAFQKVLDHVRKTNPWVLLLGRCGVHSPKEETRLGSNSENLLRLCPCDVYLTTKLAYPTLEVKAEESIKWTEEAEERMGRVPDAVKGVARTAIVRLAIEQGHSVITSALVGEAMDRYMPKHAAQSTLKLAQALAFDSMRNKPVFICTSCRVAANQPDPVKCGVCGATDFEVVTQDIFEKIARDEGGIEEETTYDGRTLNWSIEAREAVGAIQDGEMRRRTKSHIEKSARGNKVGIVTLAFCRRIIEEETGKPLSAPRTRLAASSGTKGGVETTAGETQERPAVGVDSKGVALDSNYSWTQDALARILRVPAGFMRNKVQGYVEELASERAAAEIDLPLVEAGLEVGRRKMEEMVGNSDSQNHTTEPVPEVKNCPATEESAEEDATPRRRTTEVEMMNEVGLMSSMKERRKAIGEIRG